MKWTQVTRSNFAQILPAVLESIKAADFVAFDTELTGLNLTRAHRNSQLDDLQSRYAKLRESVANFGLLQVGLACFSWSGKKQKFSISAFSFYVFPSAANGFQQERKFSCQLGSLSFLTEHGFDFNKAFREGIPFITCKEEQIIKSNSAFYRPESASGTATANQQELVVLKDDEKAFVGQVLDQVGAWMEAAKTGKVDELATFAAGSCSFTAEAIDLPPLNSYQRLIFYQQIPLKYGDSLQIVKKAPSVLSIRLAEQDPERRAAAFAQERAQFDRALAEQVGFRQVIDALSEAKVPIVGHNCLVDLMHFYNKFVDSSFPAEVSDFKAALLKQFPLIFDTKYLAKQAGLTENSLGDLAKWAESMPELSFFRKGSSGSSKDDSVDEETKFHDAGFDSICTGQAFLALLTCAAKVKEAVISGAADPLSLKDNYKLVHAAFGNPSLRNRLNVMQSDYECMLLDGVEAEPDRSNVLFLQGLPSSSQVQPSEISAAVSRLATMPVVLQVRWCDDCSCFVQFESAEMAESVLSGFKAGEEASKALKQRWPQVKLLSFAEAQEPEAKRLRRF